MKLSRHDPQPRRGAAWVCTWAAVCLLAAAAPAPAMMAGKSPDTPAARVDANSAGSAWRGVVAVLVNGGTYSGVLVSPRHVLTAGHVFDGNPPVSTAAVQFNLGAGPVQVAVAGYAKHPDYVSFGNPNIQNDLAIVELAEQAPAGAAIYPLASGVPAAGTVVTLVGYGGSGNGDVGITLPRAADVKRTGRNALDAFDVDAKGSGRILAYYFDFDGPNGTGNVIGGATLGNSIETSIAGGDSGSPAFVQEAGVWKLAGISTFTATVPGGATVASTFGTLGGGQVVASHAAWITGITASAYAGAGDADVPEFGALGTGFAATAMTLAFAASVRRRSRRR